MAARNMRVNLLAPVACMCLLHSLPSLDCTLTPLSSAQDAIDARHDVVEGTRRMPTYMRTNTDRCIPNRVCAERGQVHRSQGRSEAVQQDGLRQIDCIGMYFYAAFSLSFKISFLVQFTVAESSDYTSAKVASARVTLMLNLRSVVKNLPALAKSIEGGQSRLLHFLHKVRVPTFLSLSLFRPF